MDAEDLSIARAARAMKALYHLHLVVIVLTAAFIPTCALVTPLFAAGPLAIPIVLALQYPFVRRLRTRGAAMPWRAPATWACRMLVGYAASFVSFFAAPLLFELGGTFYAILAVAGLIALFVYYLKMGQVVRAVAAFVGSGFFEQDTRAAVRLQWLAGALLLLTADAFVLLGLNSPLGPVAFPLGLATFVVGVYWFVNFAFLLREAGAVLMDLAHPQPSRGAAGSPSA
jgi:hypothetical protein